MPPDLRQAHDRVTRLRAQIAAEPPGDALLDAVEDALPIACLAALEADAWLELVTEHLASGARGRPLADVGGLARARRRTTRDVEALRREIQALRHDLASARAGRRA